MASFHILVVFLAALLALVAAGGLDTHVLAFSSTAAESAHLTFEGAVSAAESAHSAFEGAVSAADRVVAAVVAAVVSAGVSAVAVGFVDAIMGHPAVVAMIAVVAMVTIVTMVPALCVRVRMLRLMFAPVF